MISSLILTPTVVQHNNPLVVYSIKSTSNFKGGVKLLVLKVYITTT